MPPWVSSGVAIARRMSPSGSGESMASRFSATVLPVTVMQSPLMSPASYSARMTTGTPPTRSTSLIT